MRHRFEAPAFALLALTFGAVAMQASPLLPGSTISPVPLALAPAGTPLLLNTGGDTQGGLNEGFSWKMINANQSTTLGATGNFINAVYIDPNTGFLDFYFQIQNTFLKPANSQDTLISSFNLTSWADISITEVDQLTQSTPGNFFGDGSNVEFFGPTGNGITSVSRSSGMGDEITVNLASPLAPGQNTAVLLLKTTSTDFDLGSGTLTWVAAPPACSVAPTPTNLTPCGVAATQTFGLGALEPIVPTATPEPGTAFLAIGVIAVWIGQRGRSARKVKA